MAQAAYKPGFGLGAYYTGNEEYAYNADAMSFAEIGAQLNSAQPQQEQEIRRDETIYEPKSAWSYPEGSEAAAPAEAEPPIRVIPNPGAGGKKREKPPIIIVDDDCFEPLPEKRPFKERLFGFAYSYRRLLAVAALIVLFASPFIPSAVGRVKNINRERVVESIEQANERTRSSVTTKKAQVERIFSDEAVRAYAAANGLISVDNFNAVHIGDETKTGVIRSGGDLYEDDNIVEKTVTYVKGLFTN